MDTFGRPLGPATPLDMNNELERHEWRAHLWQHEFPFSDTEKPLWVCSYIFFRAGGNKTKVPAYPSSHTQSLSFEMR